MGKVVAHKHAREVSPETKTMVTKMNFKSPGMRQIPWYCGPRGDPWFANLYADVDDVAAVDKAMRLIDEALPQTRSTAFGGHYYSFLRQEYLLNLMLFFYQDHRRFPSGDICIVDRWVWDGVTRSRGWWVQALARRFGVNHLALKSAGYWISLPKTT